MEFDDLERLIDRHLKALPAPRAPHTLLPRVLAAADGWSRRPWYARGWAHWPRGWQVASLAGLAGVAAMVAVVAVPAVQGYAMSLIATALAAPLVSDALAAIRAAIVAVDVARTVWAVLVEPFAMYLLAVAAVLYASCVAFGIALERVATGRALSS